MIHTSIPSVNAPMTGINALTRAMEALMSILTPVSIVTFTIGTLASGIVRRLRICRFVRFLLKMSPNTRITYNRDCGIVSACLKMNSFSMSTSLKYDHCHQEIFSLCPARCLRNLSMIKSAGSNYLDRHPRMSNNKVEESLSVSNTLNTAGNRVEQHVGVPMID